MRIRWFAIRFVFKVLLTALLVAAFQVGLSRAQVTPNEILSPDLKVLEDTYFQQLIALNRSITGTKFPYPFYLSRYVGLDPAKQVEADSRGLEFVRFQDRKILKITGNYNAAYNTLRLTRNERAAATLRSVVLPILNLMTSVLPENIGCDGFGFEVSHHARVSEKSYDYEGKEILVVVLDRADAWAMSHAQADTERQEILNRNKVFVNGDDYGLSLTEKDPLNVQALPRSIPARPDASSTTRSSLLASRSPLLKPPAGPPPTGGSAPEALPEGPAKPEGTPTASRLASANPDHPKPPMTRVDADRLNEKYNFQLVALAKEGAEKYHFASYAPPAFVIFHDQVALQLTLKNTQPFGPVKGSIYKRAAQSFDLFLAPLLMDVSGRVSQDVEFQLFDFTVLNKLSLGTKEASEAVEFICPRNALKRFVNAEITNQELLDQSIILVNGVRIALNLQLVE
jgi:hypothetical protein